MSNGYEKSAHNVGTIHSEQQCLHIRFHTAHEQIFSHKNNNNHTDFLNEDKASHFLTFSTSQQQITAAVRCFHKTLLP